MWEGIDLANIAAWVASFIGLGGLAALATRKSSTPTDPNNPGTEPPPPPDPDPSEDPTVPIPTQLDPRPPKRDAFGVFFARGSANPLWPIGGDAKNRTPIARWARGRVTNDFGNARPYGAANPTRHHAGEDLNAPRGTLLLATERGKVVAIDESWYRNTAGTMTGATYVQLDSGIVVNYGETEPGSTKALGLEVGSVVERGDPVGKVGATLMVHFETYVTGTTASQQWPWKGAPPARLLDPTEYLQLASSTVP